MTRSGGGAVLLGASATILFGERASRRIAGRGDDI
jgi:hypothetical protein